MNLKTLLFHTQQMTKEVGGYFEFNPDGVMFLITSSGKRNVSTGREYVNLPTRTHTLLWHFHPLHLGIWPSFEDLMLSVPTTNKPFDSYINLVLTPLGCWIFDGMCCQSNSSANRENTNYRNALYDTWLPFHMFMTEATQRVGGWDMDAIRRAIEQFRYNMLTKHQFRITFIDNSLFRSISGVDEYVSDVENYIRYITPTR